METFSAVNSTEPEEVKKYLNEQFDYDQLRYTTLDYRGAAVATGAQVDELAVELIKSLNNLQLIYGGVSAIGIAIGFLMLNTGSISLKNTNTMLRVSLIENMVCAVCIWCLGYRISMDSIGGLIGTGLDFDIFRAVPDENCMKFIVLFACAQFTSSITTGALAERTYVDTQIAFKVMLNVLIFPIIASWVWGGGWLSKYGYQDFGGSGVVHIVGGTCGLVGAAILGPRLGLFNDSLPIVENKIREKLERLEHQYQNLQAETSVKVIKLRELTIEYNNYIERQAGELAGSRLQNSDSRPRVYKHGRQLYGSQEMVRRTVSEIMTKAQNPGKANNRDCFAQQKTWKSLIEDPRFCKQLQRHSKSPEDAKRNSRLKSSLHMKPQRSHRSPDIKSKKLGLKGGNLEDSIESHKTQSIASDGFDIFKMQTEKDPMAFTKFSKHKRMLMISILKADNRVKLNINKLHELAEKIEKLKRKYVNAFRVRNSELRHFKTEQIKDYTDMLIKESQNLRQPNSTILVTGGVLFIFFGTLSLSILITRVFYPENYITGKTHDVYLKQANTLMEVGFLSMIDKLASVSGSVVAVLLLKPIIYGTWRTQEQTSCVYNVETISSSVIAGIASVAGASGYIAIHSSAIIGAIGGVIYLLSSLLLNRYQLDDPLQATQTHLFCGLWGVIAFGLTHNEKGLLTTGNFSFMGIQLVGCIVIFLFTFILTFVFFQLVRRRFHLRLTKVEEVLGSDLMEDERVMQSFVANFLQNNFDKSQRAKINLIWLVKTGMHQSKRKSKKVDMEVQELDRLNVRMNMQQMFASRPGLQVGLKNLKENIQKGLSD